jgi:hypothetical protein
MSNKKNAIPNPTGNLKDYITFLENAFTVD